MRWTRHTFLGLSNFLLLFLLLPNTNSATVKDIFTSRIPRDNKYYPSRYDSSSSNVGPLNRAIKPEESPEAQEGTPTPVEKRCTRCDSSYSDTRYSPYETRGRYDERRYKDRYDYDDRRYDDRRYERYDDRYDRRPYERDERRPYERDERRPYERDERRPYERDDRRPYERDERRPYERDDRRPYERDDRDRYRDRYDDQDPYSRRDPYDKNRYYDRDYERGFGYDNRGYDYRDRGYNDYEPPSGYGGGRGYPGGGRPDSGSAYWGTGGGYASNWNYGGGRDDYRESSQMPDPQERPKNVKYGGSYGRPPSGGGRDPYEGYRSTSYLYGRPSSTTTDRPAGSGDSDSSVTQNPQESSSG